MQFIQWLYYKLWVEIYSDRVYNRSILFGKGAVIMDKSKLDRIGELYRKSKAEGLTEKEKTEQATLRKEYIDLVKRNFRNTLNSIEYKD